MRSYVFSATLLQGLPYSDPSLNGTVRFPPLNGTEKEKLIKGVSSCHIDLFHTPLEAP